MDSDEDQQALAWQQIIKSRAFDNVRVRRGESWVDAACRTLDELIDKSCPEDDVTPEVVWRERALEAERYLMEAHRELDEARRLLVAKEDEAVNECHRAYRERDEWKARAEQAETYRRTVEQQAANAGMSLPVSRADVEEAVRSCPAAGAWNGSRVETEGAIDAVWSLVSGDDPAVFVVRESDVSAVRVTRDSHDEWFADGDHVCTHGAEDARNLAASHLRMAVQRLAVARAIEAAVDSVEKKARELWEATREGGAPVAAWSDAHEDAQAQFRILARQVIGRENHD